ncbi:MAG: hypothetical protein JXQ75_03275 [Phycisphaerae bacterium]|nr:hypothetical protein [Phycisphaerae bacterium]
MKSHHPRFGSVCLASVLILGLAPACLTRSADTSRNETPSLSTEPYRPSPAMLCAGRDAIQRKYARLRAEGPKRFDQPQEALDFYLQQRLAPGQSRLPLDHLRAELNKIRAREALQAGPRDGRSLPGGVQGWNAIGPGNIGGRTRAIVFDPQDPDIMYAAGVAGGIWKSTDAGANWTVTDDLMLNLAVSTIAIDPSNSNILYAGTGEGFLGGRPGVQGLGIFKSTDAGATWTQLAGTVTGVPEGAFYYVNKLVISPNDPTRIYAATRFGVWRSLDSGQTWSAVLRNPHYQGGVPATNGCMVGCTDLAVRTDRNPDVLFAAFGSFESDGLYRSDDGGDSWVAYTTGSYQGRMTIAIAPSDNDVIYLAMADNGGLYGFGRLVSVFRADDGVNFSSVLDFDHPFSLWLFSYVSIATGCFKHPVVYSQGWYDNIIAVDPVDPDIVWVGGINVHRSDDGGQTFGLAGYWFYYLMDPPPPTYIHPDQHAIVFHPDYDGTSNQVMYVGNDGGIFRTTNARAATSQEECPIGPDPGPPPDVVWESMNNSYGVTQFYHGDSARDVDMFVGGAQDNGTSRALATGAPDGWKMIYGGDGGYVAIDPTNGQRLFIETNGFPKIYVSNDGGETSEEATAGITDTDGVFITPLAMDQSNPDILWTGGTRPWRTTNGATSWEVAGPNFAGPDQITAIAIAPSDSNVVYLGFTNGYIARTTNALDPSPTWTIFVNGLWGAWVSSVAVDPDEPDTAYCTYSNYGVPHVLRSVDGGSNWISIDGIEVTGVPDIPAHWIAVRPCDSQQLYVGTELGVFASDNGGSTWQPANNGLAHTVVETLDLKDDNTLVAFTHGRGAYITSLLPCGCAPGDVNGDDVFDIADIGPFVGVLLDPTGATPREFCAANINADSDVDGLDLQAFVDALLP